MRFRWFALVLIATLPSAAPACCLGNIHLAMDGSAEPPGDVLDVELLGRIERIATQITVRPLLYELPTRKSNPVPAAPQTPEEFRDSQGNLLIRHDEIVAGQPVQRIVVPSNM